MTVSVTGCVISIVALVVAIAVMVDQNASNRFAKEAQERTLASRVTFWQIEGASATEMFPDVKPKVENIIQIQNRSTSGVDWLIFEREYGGEPGRWYVLPELPPCASLSFPAPYEEKFQSHWEIEGLYFYNEDGWWWRGDAGSLKRETVDRDAIELEYDTGLANKIDGGVWPYVIQDLEACQ
jgi:hypothetical protein